MVRRTILLVVATATLGACGGAGDSGPQTGAGGGGADSGLDSGSDTGNKGGSGGTGKDAQIPDQSVEHLDDVSAEPALDTAQDSSVDPAGDLDATLPEESGVDASADYAPPPDSSSDHDSGYDWDAGPATCPANSIDSHVQSNGTLILASDSFWNTANLGAYGAAVGTALSAMPPALKVAPATLTAAQRSEQLQWAVVAANAAAGLASPPTKTRLVVSSCEYDLSTTDAHSDAPIGTRYRDLLPKLFVAHNAMAIEGDPAYAPPHLYYVGAGKDLTNHGRVLILVKSGLTGVSLSKLHLSGDHSWAHRFESAYYLHENDAALGPEGGPDHRTWHGLITVGLLGGPNGVTIDSLRMDAFSRAGISVIGNATITNSTITGIAPVAYAGMNSDFDAIILAINDAGAGGRSFGMGFNTGVSQSHDYGPMTVEWNTIRNVVEGVTGQPLSQTWTIRNNTFQTVADHGIYLLGVLQKSTLDSNAFLQVHSSAIKVGGSSCQAHPLCLLPTDPIAPGTRAGAFASSLSHNTFQLVRSALQISGTFNTIANNSVEAYDPTGDPSVGGQYNPALDPTNVYPDFWLSTHGGQTVAASTSDGTNIYSNHVAFNKVTGNSKSVGTLSILLTQPPLHRDKSIAFNWFDGAGQTVYVKSRLDSAYAPMVSVSGGTTLIVGGPPNCGDCNGGPPWSGYRTTIDATTIEPVSLVDSLGASVPHVLTRYGTEATLYLLGENGVHNRLTPEGTVINVLMSADLTGDGQDEIYYRIGTDPVIRRADYYPNPSDPAVVVDLTAATGVYAAVFAAPIQAARVLKRRGEPAQLVLAFPADDRLFGTSLSGGTPVLGGPIYTGSASDLQFPSASTTRLLVAADAATAGESDSAHPGEELYAAFNNGAIVGVHWDAATSSWKRANVYSGTQTLSIAASAKLRSADSKQRLYQQFSGTRIYESAPPSSGLLPGLGTGSIFYDGPATCDRLVAGDLDGDGLDELAVHYSDLATKIYWAEETGGTVVANAGLLYDGSGTPTAIKRRVDNKGGDRLLTLFAGFRTIYLSEKLVATGHDYSEWIRQQVWTALGL